MANFLLVLASVNKKLFCSSRYDTHTTQICNMWVKVIVGNVKLFSPNKDVCNLFFTTFDVCATFLKPSKMQFIREKNNIFCNKTGSLHQPVLRP